jgi:hypothetical protein
VNFDQQTRTEWRELGFYYDFDERPFARQWRFFGSRAGLLNWALLLEKYAQHSAHAGLSEHKHYGPYWYLKVMTWNQAQITEQFWAGTLGDIARLATQLRIAFQSHQPGQTFLLTGYGESNTVGVRFFVMADDFDPATLDEQLEMCS